jgi:hypothetical protein
VRVDRGAGGRESSVDVRRVFAVFAVFAAFIVFVEFDESRFRVAMR